MPTHRRMGQWVALVVWQTALAQGQNRGLGLVFQQLSALLFTLALGFAVVGGLVYILASQGAANRRWAYLLWAMGATLFVLGWTQR
ncbi:hypothetical protein [Allomeiothermus silvanus]|nr:hypothetical protein [Allomeiothermus silvanus]